MLPRRRHRQRFFQYVGMFALGALASSFLRSFLSLMFYPLEWTRPRPAPGEVWTELSGGKSPYDGPRWWGPQTLEVREVVASPFANCEVHTIATPSGDAVHDWVWWNEKDQVNVVMQLAGDAGSPEKKYLIFRQTRYGFPTDSYATLGGLIENGEAPLEAAKRELLEETGMEAAEWVPLGGPFRISSTRGGGHNNCFLALSCYKSGKFLPTDDMEKTSQVEISESQLEEYVLSGQMLEAKWTQAVALALVYLRKQRD